MSAQAEAGRSDRETTRILIVDDHPLVRYGLGLLLSDEPDFELCGDAETADEGFELVKTTQPDLVIVDLVLKEGTGIALLKRIKAEYPGITTLVVSMHQEALYAERIVRAGAMGFVNKRSANRDIVGAVRHVLRGDIYLSEDVAARMKLEPRQAGDTNAEPMIKGLTDRELQVFNLIGEGLATRLIADHLNISISTVETHQERIKVKLGLSSGHDLTRRALQWVLEGYEE